MLISIQVESMWTIYKYNMTITYLPRQYKQWRRDMDKSQVVLLKNFDTEHAPDLSVAVQDGTSIAFI